MSYAIKGIHTKTPSGFAPLRNDIDTWYNSQSNGNRIQLSLFILALDRMQKLDYNDKLSFFSIAGIHSAPWKAWDGAPDPSEYGYCVHNNVTFPTWHRVYMLLIEQVLYENMLSIIKKVPRRDRESWRAEADQWRLPYWDFAKYAEGTEELRLPILCMMPDVDILEPHGYWYPVLQQTRKRNPVYAYDASQLMGNMGITDECGNESCTLQIPWSKCAVTTKYGLLSDFPEDVWANAEQHWQKSNAALNDRAWQTATGRTSGTIRKEVHRLFCNDFSNWGSFASTKFMSDTPLPVTDNLSLEFVHNNIHSWTGGFDFTRTGGNEKYFGAGHMSSIAMAAFDPLFFVYHCNIDRLSAMWEALNGEHWFDNPQEGDALPTDSLEPFHKDENHTPYISNDVRQWTNLGYDYGILQNPETGERRTEAEIKRGINHLYGDIEEDAPKPSMLQQPLQLSPTTEHDYMINIVYDRFSLNGVPYKAYLYIGEPDQNVPPSPDMRYYVGSLYNFSTTLDRPAEVRCKNCEVQQQQGILSGANIPVLDALRVRVGEGQDDLASLEPEDVREYLKRRPLKYYITDSSQKRRVSLSEVALYHGSVRIPRRDDGRSDPDDLPVIDPSSFEKIADGSLAD